MFICEYIINIKPKSICLFVLLLSSNFILPTIYRYDGTITNSHSQPSTYVEVKSEVEIQAITVMKQEMNDGITA